VLGSFLSRVPPRIFMLRHKISLIEGLDKVLGQLDRSGSLEHTPSVSEKDPCFLCMFRNRGSMFLGKFGMERWELSNSIIRRFFHLFL